MLDFMLAVDDARVEPLRKQADHATVVSLCGCGCATINLAVDRDAAPVAPGLPYAVVDASRRRPFPDDDFYEMIFSPAMGGSAAWRLCGTENQSRSFRTQPH
jgi:hypothetical protein